MSAEKDDTFTRNLRILLSILLLVAGLLAVKAVDSIAATEILIENTVIGGRDALPRATRFLVVYREPLRLLTMVVCVIGLCGVGMPHKKGWILTNGVAVALLLFLQPPFIRFILKQAFVPVLVKGEWISR